MMNFTRSVLRGAASSKQLYTTINSTSHNAVRVGKCSVLLSSIDNTFFSIRNYSQLFRKYYATCITHERYKATAVQQEELHRNENNVTIIGKNVPAPYTDIQSSDFPPYIKDYLQEKGFNKPTVIQAQGWPIALSGQNFVGIAQTGTGKTLAYLLPAIVHIKEKQNRRGLGPIVLVLAPTRELARQIEHVANDLGSSLKIRCACVYGGASRSVQAQKLNRGVDIVIATPGRLNDFLDSRTTTLNRCTYVVLDEADRMLDMGFEPQIRQALEGVPLERQILMWSATWPKEVQSLAKDYLGDFVQVNVGSTELSANHNITQHLYVCDHDEKMGKFKSIIKSISEDQEHGKVLVFANTKKLVDSLTFTLHNSGWPTVGIHGDKSQMQRDAIIHRFKTGKSKILVATDVAARGLDVDGVSYVINYDFPNTTEDYIHRIGRTGRSESKGTAYTLLTSEDSRHAKSLISILKEANQEVPQELLQMQNSKIIERTFRKPYRSNYQNSWGTKNKWNNRRKYDDEDYY